MSFPIKILAKIFYINFTFDVEHDILSLSEILSLVEKKASFYNFEISHN